MQYRVEEPAKAGAGTLGFRWSWQASPARATQIRYVLSCIALAGLIVTFA
jgi:hypothetical protein